MIILTSIILIVAIILVTVIIAYYMQKGTKTLEELRSNYYNNGETQEVDEFVMGLYNKDLRPIVVKKVSKIVEKVTVEDVLGSVNPTKKNYSKKLKKDI